MADVTKVKLNGITYDIKDPTKVKVSGDTMTGDLKLKSTTIDYSSLTPPVSYLSRGLTIVDTNDKVMGYIANGFTTSNQLRISVGVTRNINEIEYGNSIRLNIDESGNRSVELNGQAWRKALNTILHYKAQTVSVASNAQIMRIPSSGTDSAITTDTVVLDCEFADETKVCTSDVTWQSYNGYITFTGTCTSATTADVVLGNKSN